MKRSLALLSVVALGLAACSSNTPAGQEPAASADPNAPVTLRVATFNEFGYEELFEEYMADHPNVKIEHEKAATTDESRDNLNTRLAAGSGLSDIEAVEVDWLPELMQYSDKFVDLTNDDVKDRWLDWKTAAATTQEETAGLRPEGIWHGQFDRTSGAALVVRIERDEVDGLFVCNDLMALGVLDAFAASGVAVPDDVKVVGYDDISLGEHASLPLTTVTNPAAEMAALATAMLLEQLRSGVRPQSRVLEPVLVERRSG